MKKIIYSVLEKGKNHNKQKSKYHLPIYIPKRNSWHKQGQN